ncbi:MAG: PaaI family thioesterase [Bacteroidales bacterium]|nr:PaaI family thioesterase [Bacteroidales bacterium]
MHGGILSTLIDEIAGWTLYVKARCAGVTSRMNIRYRKPAPSTQGELLFRGKIKTIKRNLCYIDVELFNSNNEICTEAEVIYFMFSREKSINEYYYPEDDSAFFDE